MTVNPLGVLGSETPALSVSILSGDLMRLSRDVEVLEAAGVRFLHFDVMDGRFCPSLTFGPWFVEALKTTMVKDVHLMVEDPVDAVETFVSAGAGIITVHLESGRHVHRALEMIGESSPPSGNAPMRGLAVNPGTPLSAVAPYLDCIDILQVLGINPGWRQNLIGSTLDRVRNAQQLIDASGRNILIAVDGGITSDNLASIASLGPSIVVSGGAVFANDEIELNVRHLTDILSHSDQAHQRSSASEMARGADE